MRDRVRRGRNDVRSTMAGIAGVESPAPARAANTRPLNTRGPLLSAIGRASDGKRASDHKAGHASCASAVNRAIPQPAMLTVRRVAALD